MVTYHKSASGIASCSGQMQTKYGVPDAAVLSIVSCCSFACCPDILVATAVDGEVAALFHSALVLSSLSLSWILIEVLFPNLSLPAVLPSG